MSVSGRSSRETAMTVWAGKSSPCPFSRNLRATMRECSSHPLALCRTSTAFRTGRCPPIRPRASLLLAVVSRSPRSRQAAGSERSASRSDKTPPPVASDATSAQSVALSDGPRHLDLTLTASAKAPKRSSHLAVEASAEQPPKPVKRSSVNSCSTFRGRGNSVFIWRTFSKDFANR